MENNVKAELMILTIWSAVMLQSGMLPTSYSTNVGNKNIQAYSIKQEEEQENKSEITNSKLKKIVISKPEAVEVVQEEEQESETEPVKPKLKKVEISKPEVVEVMQEEEQESETEPVKPELKKVEVNVSEVIEVMQEEIQESESELEKTELKKVEVSEPEAVEKEEFLLGEESVTEETAGVKFINPLTNGKKPIDIEAIQAKKQAEKEAKKAKAEAERLAKEEAERLAREEAERLAKVEAERLAKEEAERLAKEEEKAKAEAEARKLNTDPTTLTFLVNKEYILPKNYIPVLVEPKVNHCQPTDSHKRYMRPEAAKALEEMFAAAKKDGYDLWVKTAYRSYKNQYDTYTWVLKYLGEKEAIYYHAVPGRSEHQTGLAVDIVCKASNYENELIFGKTKEYTWLKENCYKYGFTLRYWKDKEHITGYKYEPWHYRYVGVELATYLMEHQLTLEEYYNALPTTDLFQVPKEYQYLIPKTESKE